MYQINPSRYISHLSNSASRQSLVDNYGRAHNYLRISLTEKCNLRCRYCMPEEGIRLSSRVSYMTLDEIKRLAGIFVKTCGINKIRLTGGEPTIDKKLYPLIEYLNDLRGYGLNAIGMTTNGLSLKRNVSHLKKLGLNNINISLDSMRPERFELMTRRKGWGLAYEGIMSALNAGFDIVKVNCVVIKGVNHDELSDFVDLARSYPVEVRFIEFMPFAGNKWNLEQMISYKEMLQIVREKVPDLERVATNDNDVSKVYRDANMLGSIGFISSMSDHFCHGCNRLRITSDGNLKTCLFGPEETSLRDLIRNGANDIEIKDAIERALKGKKLQHADVENLLNSTSRPMVKIARNFHKFSGNSRGFEFSHLNSRGEANMVNVGNKSEVKRVAKARGKIYVGSEILEMIRDKTMKKGDIINVARIAGIMGAKLTSNLIPLCHTIPLDHVHVDIELSDSDETIIVEAVTEAHHKTGVEMEALTAVTTTLLTLYDMCKSVNKAMVISDVKMVSKVKHSSI